MNRQPSLKAVPTRILRIMAVSLTSLHRDAMYRAVNGVCSAGLRTTQFPVARAGANFHVAIKIG